MMFKKKIVSFWAVLCLFSLAMSQATDSASPAGSSTAESPANATTPPTAQAAQATQAVAPSVDGIPDQSIEEKKNFQTILLDNYVKDVEFKNAQLKWEAKGQKDLSVSINPARVVTIKTPDRYWNGVETITFVATNPLGASGSQSVTFTVNSVNDAPTIKPISGQNIEEGQEFQTIRLDDIIEDKDHPKDQIQWNTEVNMIGKSYRDLPLAVEISADRIATIAIPDTNWYGSASITFTATDGEGASVNTKSVFNVKSINDPPIVIKIPDQKISEGKEFQSINLSDYVSDVDHNASDIKWQVTGGMKLQVKIDANNVATVQIPHKHYNGPAETFTFTARDPEGANSSTKATFEVTSVNDLPEFKPIDNQAIDEKKSFASINLKALVSDPDNSFDELVFEFIGAKELEVKNSGGVVQILTPNPNWHGEESITFVANDPEGGKAQQTATFTVRSINDIPVVKPLPPQTIKEGQAFAPIVLDEHVEDVDHPDDQITWDFQVRSKNSTPGKGSIIPQGALIVQISSDRVATIVIPDTNWHGAATITFSASDPEGGQAEFSTDFTVESVNDLPKLRKIPDQKINEGNEFGIILLDEYVSDVDHDIESLTWSASSTGALKVNINKDRIAKIIIPDRYWNGPPETITFTVTDPEGGSVQSKSIFEVLSVNNLPELTQIKDQTIQEKTQFATIRLDDIVSDVDHKDSEIKWTFAGNKDLKVSLDANRIASIVIPNALWHGSETITFTATDPEGGSAQTSATFTVKSVNDVPQLKPIPDQVIEEGEVFRSIRLDDFVEDPDHADDVLKWEFVSKIAGQATAGTNAAPELKVILNENRVANVVIPDTNWHGAETITFTVTDPEGAQKSVNANYTVRSVNDIPILQPIKDQTINEGEQFQPIPLFNLVHDVDHDIKQLKWKITGNTHLKFTIDTAGYVQIGIPHENWNGAPEKVTFTVTDPENGTASRTATFTVISVNDPPILQPIPPQTIQEKNDFTTIPLSELVSDVDHSYEQLKWDITGTKELKVLITGGTARIVIPHKHWHGSETITFTVTDPEGGMAKSQTTMTVESVNDLPKLKSISPQAIDEKQTFKSLQLDELVSDIDHNANEMTWSFKSVLANNPQKAGELKVNVDASRIATVIIPHSHWHGDEVIQFTVRDPEGGADSIQVPFSVRSVNDIPVLKQLPSQTIKEKEKFNDIHLLDYVSDADHSVESLMWSFSGNKDLIITIKKGTAHITQPVTHWNGTETIIFTVKDPEGGSANSTVTLTATSVNDLPIIKGLQGQTIKEGGSFSEIKLDSYVSDIDHTNADLQWTITGNQDLLVDINPARIATIKAPHKHWNGSEMLVFTVVDPEDGKASATLPFTVESVNDAPVIQKIPGQVIDEGAQFTTIALDEYVTDVDHSNDQLKWNVQISATESKAPQGKKAKPEAAPNVAKSAVANAADMVVHIDGNRIARIILPDTNWHGARNLHFTVTDPDGAKASTTSGFVVKSINDLPVINPQLGKAILVDEGSKLDSISLNEYVYDVDHAISSLKWNISGAKELVVKHNPKTNVVALAAPHKHWHGTETLLFTVVDPEGGKAAIEKIIEFRSINDLPMLKQIPDQTIKEKEQFKEIRLDDFVKDPDHTHEQLQWKVSGMNQLKANINEKRILTVQAPYTHWNGPTESLTLTVSDPENGTASMVVKYTVISVNDPPEITAQPKITYNEGDMIKAISLDELVKDVDHKPSELAWKVKIVNPEQSKKPGEATPPDITATIDANRNLLVKVPDEHWNGFRELHIAVKDPEGGIASGIIELNVISINDDPEIRTIPGQIIQEGDAFAPVPLNKYVRDVDHSIDELRWRFKGNKDLLVKIDEQNNLLVKTPHEDWFGSETLEMMVEDPLQGRAFTKITYEVTPVNDPPVINPKAIQGQVINEGEAFAIISLKNAAKDVDNAQTELKWKITGGNHLKIKLDEMNNEAKVIIPHEDWFGPAESFTFIVSDPAGASATHVASFTVNPVNDAPVVKGIPGQTIKEKQTFTIFDLKPFVKDVDNKISELAWTTDCAIPDFVQQKINAAKKQKGQKNSAEIAIPKGCAKNQLKVDINKDMMAKVSIPNQYWNGKESIVFTAWDPEGAFGSQNVTFEVESVNDIPQVRAPTGYFAVEEGEKFPPFGLDSLVEDPDHSKNQITWKFSGNRHLDILISANRVAAVRPMRNDWSGEEEVTFTATDPEGGSASFTKKFVVRHVNRSPEMRPIPNQTINEDTPFKSIEMNKFARDRDHANHELRWEFKGNKSLIVDVDHPKGLIHIKAPREHWHGPEEKICFRVSDPEGAFATQCATFKVLPVNDPPEVLDHSYAAKEGVPLIVNVQDGLLNNAKDPDGDPVGNCTLVKPPKNGTLTLNKNGSFKYVPKKGFYGLDEFTFKAIDKEGASSNIARVEINVQFSVGDIR